MATITPRIPAYSVRTSDQLFQRFMIQEVDIVSTDPIPTKIIQQGITTAPAPVVAADSSSIDTWIGDEILWAVDSSGDVLDDQDWLSFVSTTAPATDNFEFWAWHEGSVMEDEGISSILNQMEAGTLENIL